jgi:hypothetical protein
MTICNTGDNTPVMEVDDAAVVPHIMIFQEQIREIYAPFLIESIYGKVLLQLVIKHFILSCSSNRQRHCVHGKFLLYCARVSDLWA